MCVFIATDNSRSQILSHSCNLRSWVNNTYVTNKVRTPRIACKNDRKNTYITPLGPAIRGAPEKAELHKKTKQNKTKKHLLEGWGCGGVCVCQNSTPRNVYGANKMRHYFHIHAAIVIF